MTVSPRRTGALTVRAPLERSDLAGLVQRTCALLEDDRIEVLCCDVTAVKADAVALDALSRLALAARQRRCEVRLCGASAELLELVSFAGLSGVLDGSS